MEILNDMALFVEVVNVMSFRKASEVTGIPNSSVSRRISGLENALGLRLLNRTTRKIELTEAGTVYFERCKRIVEEAKLAHVQLDDMLVKPNGVIRASLPVDFANAFLAPFLPEFIRLYPDISFDFDVTPRHVDLITERYDVAIRMGEQKNSNLIARKLANMSPHLYASPRYLEIYGIPQQPSDLAAHQCFSMVGPLWTLASGAHQETVAITSRFALNSAGMIRKLATLDLGILLMPIEIVAEDLKAGRLVPIMPQWVGADVPVYAITETRLLPAKTRCFIDFVRQSLESKASLNLR